MVDVFLWVMVTDLVEPEWVAMMAGAISGFNVTGMVQYVDVSGGLSGNAITFRCRLNGTKPNFDLCTRYMHDTVMSKIRNAVYLSEIISTMALQFEHPNAGHAGLVTLVDYNMNRITNKTDATILFFNGGLQVVSIAPNAQGILDGPVSHLEGVETVLVDPAGSNAEPPATEPPAPGPPAPKPPAPEPPAPVKPKRSTKWVTYDSKPEVVRKVEMELHRAPGRNNGFLLLTNDGHNQDTSVADTVAWTDDL